MSAADETQAPQSAMDKLDAATSGDTPSTTPLADAAKPSVAEQNYLGLKERLDGYIAAMAPGKPVSNADQATNQLQLWRAFQFVITKKEAEFVSLWTLLLQYFYDHRDNRNGALSRTYAYRAMSDIRLPSPERRNFERLLNLAIVTCDPSTRRFAIKQVDLKGALAGFVDNEIVQRITAFYTL